MNRVWLVQRLEVPYDGYENNPFSFGGGLPNGGIKESLMAVIKYIFSFSYMGSAEFEWGAVPSALKALHTHKSLINFKLDNGLYVICPSEIKEDLTKWLNAIYEDEYTYPLKETLQFNRALISDSNIGGWLKIERDDYCKEPFMFFINKTMYNKTCQLFKL